MTTQIQMPEVFHLTGEQGEMYYGADQEWFADYWKRQAGCGPTNCAHLIWYLADTRPDCEGLVEDHRRTKESILALMETVWNYVTPGRMGVNTCTMFTDGAQRFAVERGERLEFQVLEVPHIAKGGRPSRAQLADFLAGAFAADRPVAFLNLSNGKLEKLHSWHWVTLTAFDPETMAAAKYDGGERTEIDMGLWLDTSILGGGFVTIDR